MIPGRVLSGIGLVNRRGAIVLYGSGLKQRASVVHSLRTVSKPSILNSEENMPSIKPVSVLSAPWWLSLRGLSSASAAVRVEEGTPPVKPLSAVPGPRGLPLIGTLLEVLRQKAMKVNIYTLLNDRFTEFGPIFKESIGSLNMVYIRDPKATEIMLRTEGKYPRRINMEPWVSWREDNQLPAGILIQDGPKWRRMRSQLDRKMMRPKEVEVYTDDFNKVITDFISYLRQVRDNTPGGTTIPELDQQLFKWSLETIGTVLYETRFGAFSDQPDPDIEQFIDAVNRMFATTEDVMYYPRKLRKYLIPKKNKAHADSWKTIFQVGTRIINSRVAEFDKAMAEGKEVRGFLSSLLANPNLSQQEVYANISELMMGAVDTTSNTMQWAIYELSRNLDVQARLQAEVDDVTAGNIVLYKQLQNMPYLRGYLKEILRMYPVAPAVARVLNDDLILLGYNLPKDTTVFSSTFMMGRDPELYEEPLKVKPERWDRTDQNKNMNYFAFIPFGFGPRACIGRRVAELEMLLLLARILQTFKIEPVNSEPNNISSRGLLVPERPVEVFFHERH